MLLDKSNTFDLIIIGGGLAGCSAAYYLIQGGMKVALIEMRSICSGASGRNGGQVIQMEGRDELDKNKIIKRNSFSGKNKLILEALNDLLGCDIEFLKIGSFDVAFSKKEENIIKNVIKLQKEAGDTHIEYLNAGEVEELCPVFGNNLHGAKIRRDDGTINPFKMTYGYAFMAVRNGLKIFTYTKVISLIFKKQKVVGVKTDKGDLYSKYGVINATNAWSKKIIDDYPIIPCKILGFVTEQLPIIPVIPMEFNYNDVGVYGSSQKDGNILIGGAPYNYPDDMTEHLNEEVYYEDFIKYGKIFSECWPKIKGVFLIRAWAGAVGFTPDSFPLVGPTIYENLFLNAGFTNGNSWCPICGKLLTEYILNDGRTSIPIDILNPERFRGIDFDWPKTYNYTVLHNYIAEKILN